MYAAASNNVIAAGFSLVISAALFAYAIIPASPSVMVWAWLSHPRLRTGPRFMFTSDTSGRLFAAAFSVMLTIGTFAYAIVPATPSLAW